MSRRRSSRSGLAKRFRRDWGLRDCTLTIPQGAIVGLAGPNAAGKSTLLALATGLLAPTEGSIAVLGRDPLREPEVLAEVGYVAQGAPLYRSFTVAETIEFARRTNARWDDEIVAELLTRIDVADEGRHALRGRPRAARARARARQAAAAAAARRAVRRARPARGPRVPAAADGRRRRDVGHGRDRLARDRRHRARLRPHRPAVRRQCPARGERRGSCSSRTAS